MPLVKPTAADPVTGKWDATQAMLPYIPGPSTFSSETNYFQSSFPLQFNLIVGATASTPAGTYYEFNTLGRNYHSIQVSAPAVINATILVEGTLDGVNWTTIESISSLKISQYTGIYQSIRVSISAYTSGTITVTSMTMRS